MSFDGIILFLIIYSSALMAITDYGHIYGEDDDKEGDKLAVQLDGKTLVAGADAAIIGMHTRIGLRFE